MLLSQKLRENGVTLFRYRSFAPLIFIPIGVLTFQESEQVERVFGDMIGDAFESFCIALVLLGLLLRAFTVGFVPAGTSGRNVRAQAAEILNTTGIYSLTRNPLYLANCMIYLGVILFTQDLYLSFAFALFLVIYYERIILAEEAFLIDRFGEGYAAWAARVPVFFPKLSGWIPPAMTFSPRTVLRREYTTWFASALALFIVEVLSDAFGTEREGIFETDWVIAMLIATACFLILRYLRRRTNLLSVRGR